MKSGFLRNSGVVPLVAAEEGRLIICPASVAPVNSAGGRYAKALLISFAVFAWWESSATIGWIPWYFLESAVMFSRKWTEERVGDDDDDDNPPCFSTMATEVSSLNFQSMGKAASKLAKCFPCSQYSSKGVTLYNLHTTKILWRELADVAGQRWDDEKISYDSTVPAVLVEEKTLTV